MGMPPRKVGEGSPFQSFARCSFLTIGPRMQSAGGVSGNSAQRFVVEDNTVAQPVITHGLIAAYKVHCVPSSAEAVRVASAETFDLVLMDLQMPDMDGIEATTRLRLLPGYASVPIIALTANTTDEYRRLCRRHGLQGFLPKPVEYRKLLETVDQFLGCSPGAGHQLHDGPKNPAP
jgi:CheY-like chemotaxis protein